MKKCIKCGETKQLPEFYRRKESKDGRRASCKACDDERVRKWHIANKDRVAANKRAWAVKNRDRLLALRREWVAQNKGQVAAYKRVWFIENRDKMIALNRAWRAKNRKLVNERTLRQYHENREERQAYSKEYHRLNPEKQRAQNAVKRAITAGRLVRPDHCSRCGKACVPDAHHEDYSKPLEVEWLCRVCHKQHHADLERRAA